MVTKNVGGLIKEALEVVFEDFRVVRHQERGRTEAGHPQTLNRYTFSLIDAANPSQPMLIPQYRPQIQPNRQFLQPLSILPAQRDTPYPLALGFYTSRDLIQHPNLP